MAFEAKTNTESKPKWVKYVNPVNIGKGIVKFFVNCGVFIKQSFGEMKRITWPTKDKVVRSTSVVLTSVILITLIIWLIDSLFNLGLSNFLKILG